MRLSLLFPRTRARFAATPRNLVGMALMTISTLALTIMQATIRMVPGAMHPFEKAFFRNLFGLLYLIAYNAPAGLGAYRTRRMKLHVVRGIFNVLSMFAFFYGMPLTPLAQVSALTFAAPLFASILAIPILKEKVRARRLVVFVIGVTGTLLILRPGFVALSLGPVLILASAATWGMALIFIKMLTGTETSGTITLYMALIMTPISLVGALPVFVTPTLPQLGVLAGMAGLGTLGHICLAQAFRMADATAVLPLDFVKLIWGSALGYLFFAEVPDIMTWVGGTIIFCSTTYLAIREAR